MKFTPAPLDGSYIVDLDRHEDQRGFFARSWCAREFEAEGLSARLVQCNISWNRSRGTLRGMHYQAAPFAEAKLVRCVRGVIHDVVLDLRPDSATYRGHFGLELSAENRRLIYVPEGVAHGFLTLVDDTEVLYQMSEFYDSEHAAGVRWDDPAFGIPWPSEVLVISDRDRKYPDFVER